MEPLVGTHGALSQDAFATLGSPSTAYVRLVEHQGRPAFAICSADGTVVAIASTRDAAFGTAMQQGLEPEDAH